MKPNKSQILSKAWKLFRQYNITWSQAMLKSWCDAKRAFYVSVYNSIPTKAQFAKKKLEAKKLYESFEVSFRLIPRSIENNSAAAHYYNGKTLNLD